MFPRWRLSADREGGKSHSSSHPQNLLLGRVGSPPLPGWLFNQMQMGLQEKVRLVLKVLQGGSGPEQPESGTCRAVGAAEAPRTGV